MISCNTADDQETDLASYVTTYLEGVAHTTIAGYYDILQDCLIAERIESLIKSNTRKKLTRSSKYLFFDLGVRRLAAREGAKPARETWGRWFEQFVGLELLRCARAQQRRAQLHFWRDPDGPEVDWIFEEEVTPIQSPLILFNSMEPL